MKSIKTKHGTYIGANSYGGVILRPLRFLKQLYREGRFAPDKMKDAQIASNKGLGHVVQRMAEDALRLKGKPVS